MTKKAMIKRMKELDIITDESTEKSLNRRSKDHVERVYNEAVSKRLAYLASLQAKIRGKKMTIYATAKYNNKKQAFEILEYYKVFTDANSDICKDVTRIKINNKVYDKIDFPTELISKWNGLIKKKDFTKQYIKKNKDVYIIKEIKVNG